MLSRVGGLGALAAGLLAGAVFAAPACAATITVTTTSDNAKGDLREAVEELAKPGDTIVLPPGRYELAEPAEELVVDVPVTIQGSGPGVTEIVATGHWRVLLVQETTGEVTIKGVTIRDGFVDEPGSVAAGGGVFDSGVPLTLEDDAITENVADAIGEPGQAGGIAEGGGVAAFRAQLRVRDSVVSKNVAVADGGEGKPAGPVSGGGISVCCQADSTTLEDVSLVENDANSVGGAGAAGDSALGGALAMTVREGASATLSGVSIEGSVVDADGADGGAGGIANGGGAFVGAERAAGVDMSAVTASDDVARAAGTSGSATGGGLLLYAQASPMSLADATIAGDEALAPGTSGIAEGGGLNSTGNESTIALVNTTIAADKVEGAGAGTGAGDLHASETSVLNSIVSAGAGPAGSQNCGGSATSLGHNIDSLDQCGFGVAGDKTDTNPQLGPLADNGGPVETMALATGSPALDAGSNAGCPASDARGVARPQGAACDIGAFELAPGVAVTGVASGVGTSSATLTGSAGDPGPFPGSTYFQYGASTAYGSSSPALLTSPFSALSPVAFKATGLAPATTYHFRLVSVDPEGTSYGADQTFTTALEPASAPVSVAPVLSHLAISPKALLAEQGKGASIATVHKKGKAKRRGASISYADSEVATTTFTVLSVRSGFRVGSRCLAKAPRHHKGKLKSCTREVSLSGFTHADAAGANRFKFTGRLKNHALAPGRYLLRAVARNAAGQSSRPLTLAFRVLR